MIYTIGLPTFNDLNEWTPDTDIHFQTEDILVIHAVGNRIYWESGPSSQSFRLKEILPTPLQRQRIHQFLCRGGTIITSLTDPEQPLTIPVFEEEVLNYPRERLTLQKSDSPLMDIQIDPYDWLPEICNQVLVNLFKQYWHFNQKVISFQQQSNLITSTSFEGFILPIGSGKGRLVLTPLLSSSPMPDFTKKLKLLIAELQEA
ncbi:hypothetical protein JOD24_002033 [Kroppenstedtia sanguinis]|uniref:hypothetical protein n=1 Tax=Kroppenstedtia sanguinis TaxID=1380684 RepID=UPI003D1A4C44